MKQALLLTLLAFATLAFAQKSDLSPETQIQYLSGRGSDDAVDWKFQCTDGRRAGEWTTIAVPSCWELQGFGTYQYGMPFYGKADPPGIAKEQGLYRYSFRLPAAWEGRLIRLVFEGVMTDCSATINQRKAVKLHQGGFYRFKADVSDRVFFGKKDNLLEVTVSKESANPSVNMAERRADYWNFGGIFRPVFIEALPAQAIDRVSIDAKGDGRFLAELNLTSALDSTYTVEGQLMDSQGQAVGPQLTVPIRGGSDRIRLEANYPGIRPWSAESPNLYRMRFRLKQGSTVKHILTERFAFRTIEVRPGDGLYLNGRKLLIKGVNRHSFRPATGRTLSKKANEEDVALIKSMNMNAVRLSHYPSDPEFLDACDQQGLYVMVELASWHQHYDTETGKQLVREMVTRDANHPSVLWWSNGNEGGWNTELDADFAVWDLQQRPLVHPQGNFGGLETMHYRSYGETQEYLRKPEIFLPTEFLHGLYDGGLGAGLYDYWELMRQHPRCAGGFLWVLADEGVVRTDQGGKIDNCGNYAADGIVGPNHEKEGSYFSIKQIWSPVVVDEPKLHAGFDGKLTVENRYDFTNLDQCRFEWSLLRWAVSGNPKPSTVLASGSLAGPSLQPHERGSLRLDLPKDWTLADALQCKVLDPFGKEVWTWTWKLDKPADLPQVVAGPTPTVERTNDRCLVHSGLVTLVFNTETGELQSVRKGNQTLSLSRGPRFVAARRGDRSMDVFYNHDDPSARSKERIYTDISGNSRLTSFQVDEATDRVVVTALYEGNFRQARWTFSNDGSICLDATYRYDGVVELMGIAFDYPESQMRSKRWLGDGPYRVWQNRLQGPTLGVWQTDYNDPVPAESFTYPEFKGYFSNWSWVDFSTTEGNFSLQNDSPGSYLGVYAPRDGRDALLYTLPQTGIAVLQVIPAVRNKVNATDLNGPSAQAHWVSGLQSSRIWFRF